MLSSRQFNHQPRGTTTARSRAPPEIPPEPFELFQSHKESLDRLYEWEKRLYEEVRVRAFFSIDSTPALKSMN